jgi:hypothetical protein
MCRVKLLLFTLLVYYCDGLSVISCIQQPSALCSDHVTQVSWCSAVDLYSRVQLLWQVNIVEVIIRYTTITARDIPFSTHNSSDVQLNLAPLSLAKLLYVDV